MDKEEGFIPTIMMTLVLGHITGEHGLRLEDLLEMKSLSLFI